LNNISNGVLQSRLTKEPMSVTGIYDLDGVSIKIQRGKKFLIEENGEVTTGSSKLTEEKLDQIIGMPRELFRKILHKRQGEGGFFLSLTPAEVHKFLTNCMGLQQEQAKILVLDTRLEILSKMEISLRSFIESNKTGLDATKNAISSLGSAPVLTTPPGGIEKLEQHYTRMTEEHDSAKNVYKREQEELDESRPQISIAPFDRSKIESLESEITSIKGEMVKFEKDEQNRQTQVKANISELQILSSKLENSELTRQSDVRNRISAKQVEISSLQALEQNRQSEVSARMAIHKANQVAINVTIKDGILAFAKASKLMEELKMVKAAMCPTCEQSWITPTAKTKENSILLELKELKKLVLAEREASAKLPTLESEWVQLAIESKPKPVPQIENLTKDIEQLKLEAKPQVIPRVTELIYQIQQLKAESEPKIVAELLELTKKCNEVSSLLAAERQRESDHQSTENAKSKLILANFALKQTDFRKSVEKALKLFQEVENKAFAEYEGFKNQVQTFEGSKKRFEDAMGRLNAQLHDYELVISNKTLELIETQEEIELALESKKVIKSYLSCSFDDALSSIGDVATRMIRSIPNMATATIQLEGLKETKEGKIKEEINCTVSVDGEPEVPIKSLSGGEGSSLDLTIDLAVMEFIQEKAGKGCSLLILDEPFTGLDHENISCVVELLRESRLNKQILIVDHNPIIKETFESKILVIRDGLTSKVMQQ
jgi:DNA repair exonuclease SbcCD ATPase subunit